MRAVRDRAAAARRATAVPRPVHVVLLLAANGVCHPVLHRLRRSLARSVRVSVVQGAFGDAVQGQARGAFYATLARSDILLCPATTTDAMCSRAWAALARVLRPTTHIVTQWACLSRIAWMRAVAGRLPTTAVYESGGVSGVPVDGVHVNDAVVVQGEDASRVLSWSANDGAVAVCVPPPLHRAMHFAYDLETDDGERASCTTKGAAGRNDGASPMHLPASGESVGTLSVLERGSPPSPMHVSASGASSGTLSVSDCSSLPSPISRQDSPSPMHSPASDCGLAPPPVVALDRSALYLDVCTTRGEGKLATRRAPAGRVPVVHGPTADAAAASSRFRVTWRGSQGRTSPSMGGGGGGSSSRGALSAMVTTVWQRR